MTAATQTVRDPSSEVGTGDSPWNVVAGESWSSTSAPSTVRAIGVSQLAQQVRELRGEHSALGPRIDEVGDQTYRREWDLRSRNLAKQTVQDLLRSLGDLGFAWRDVARMIGVSVPAVSKWRRGEPVTPENARRIHRLVAMCDLLRDHFGVQDVSTWFEVPLSVEAPVTPVDLWHESRFELLWLAAEDDMPGETVLDRFDEQWRERYRSDFETFRASDGSLSIRPRVR